MANRTRQRISAEPQHAPASRDGVGLQRPTPSIAYATAQGIMYRGFAEDVLTSRMGKKHRGEVQLILTSPPFPLNRKKKYGNYRGKDYIEWLAGFSLLFKDYLADDGSIVIEMGNAWEAGEPAMSTLALEALLRFLRTADLKLCQLFVCHNPARLPTPAQWVNIDRVRVKDSYTHAWWMAPSAHPKADNRRILKEYSASMLKLLRTRKYNHGRRPSEHHIGATSFLKDNKGAIPSNVLTFTNTRSTDPYLVYCRKEGLRVHPARMPSGLAAFFIRFLTEPGDLVMDPFAGSNTTGAEAERLERRWVSVEASDEYVQGSQGRFPCVTAR